jgi:hypothetical protein
LTGLEILSSIGVRVARPNEGKSGGFRTIILFRKGERAFFVYGFAKKDRDNITREELLDYRERAERYLTYTNEQIDAIIETGELIEILQEVSDETEVQKRSDGANMGNGGC